MRKHKVRFTTTSEQALKPRLAVEKKGLWRAAQNLAAYPGHSDENRGVRIPTAGPLDPHLDLSRRITRAEQTDVAVRKVGDHKREPVVSEERVKRSVDRGSDFRLMSANSNALITHELRSKPNVECRLARSPS